MKNEYFLMICLPNGQEFEIINPDKTLDDNNIEEKMGQYRNLFGSCSTIQVNVMPENNNGLMKKQTLILWGDVLKNTYIKVKHY